MEWGGRGVGIKKTYLLNKVRFNFVLLGALPGSDPSLFTIRCTYNDTILSAGWEEHLRRGHPPPPHPYYDPRTYAEYDRREYEQQFDKRYLSFAFILQGNNMCINNCKWALMLLSGGGLDY